MPNKRNKKRKHCTTPPTEKKKQAKKKKKKKGKKKERKENLWFGKKTCPPPDILKGKNCPNGESCSDNQVTAAPIHWSRGKMIKTIYFVVVEICRTANTEPFPSILSQLVS